MAKLSFRDALAKFHRGVGIYIDGGEIFVCRVAAEFRGIKVISSFSGPLGDKPLQAYLREIFPATAEAADMSSLPEYGKRSLPAKLGGWFLSLPELASAGVKDAAVFYYAFATSFRPGKHLEIDALVSDNPRAEFLHSAAMARDWTACQINEQNYVLMCAAKKTVLSPITEAFDKLGIRIVRVEAGAMSALRASWHQLPPSAGKLPEIRIISGPEKTLVALALGTVPLAWQLVPSGKKDSAAALFPVAQSFITYAQKQFSFSGISHIAVQGAAADSIAPALAEMTALPCRGSAGMPYDGSTIAFGLALGAIDTDTVVMDMARGGHKPVSVAMTFPYLEALITTIIVLSTLLFMYGHTLQIEKNVRLQQAVNNQDPQLAGLSVGEMASNNSNLRAQIAPMSELFTGRVQWCAMMENIGKLLTPDVRIVNFVGKDEVWTKKRTPPSVSLLIAARSSGKNKPEDEVEIFLNRLRESPELSRTFRKIAVNSIQLIKSGEEIQASISLTAK
ncbi:MAG: hypothetical protein WC421_05055 [Elusimicrobiales bacterium]